MENTTQLSNELHPSVNSLSCNFHQNQLCRNCLDLDISAALRTGRVLRYGVIARKSDQTVPWVWTLDKCCLFGQFLDRCQVFEDPIPQLPGTSTPRKPRRQTWLRICYPDGLDLNPRMPVLQIVFTSPVADFGSMRSLSTSLGGGKPNFELAFGIMKLITVSEGREQTCGPFRCSPQMFGEYHAIKEHIRNCSDSHKSGPCVTTPHDPYTPVRLIDCITLEIIRCSHSCQYLALSYVWGSPKEEAHETVCLDRKLKPIPQTIEDAISVRLRLGYRYLWVDRYCIRQENEGDFHDQIRQMHRVYQHAEATIIAAAGRDPSFGLPGVNQPRKAPQRRLSLPGYLLTSLHPLPWDLVRYSCWNSRGWTYQEFLFSRRRIVFTEQQVIFDCGQGWRSESVGQDQKPQKHYHWNAPWNILVPARQSGSQDDDLLLVYQYIKTYASRNLTYEKDVINAFQGVFGAFMRFGIYHHWGIPFRIVEHNSLTSFLFGLTWIYKYSYRIIWRTRSRCKILPSWSWAGWLCPNGLHFDSPEFEDEHFRVPSETNVGIEMIDGSTITWPEFERSMSDISKSLNFSIYIILRAWTISILIDFREEDMTELPILADGYLVRRGFRLQFPCWIYTKLDEADPEFDKDENGRPKYLGVFLSDVHDPIYGFLVIIVVEKDHFRERVGMTYFFDKEFLSKKSTGVYQKDSFTNIYGKRLDFRVRDIRLG